MPGKVEFSLYYMLNNPIFERMVLENGFSFFLETALAAEKLGFKAVWIPDHFMLPVHSTLYDPWTVLTALAVKTHDIKLSSLVTPIPFFQPHLLAKRLTCIDHISKGRVICGVGCGWYKPEFDAYNIPYGSLETRVERMLEGLEIMKLLWTQSGPVSYEGKHYIIRDALFSPKPLQKPHPPIWFGGLSRGLLKAVAQHGVGWIPIETPLDELKLRLKLLEDYLEENGRSLNEITVALASRIVVASMKSGVEEEMRRAGVSRDGVSSTGLRAHSVCGTPEECAIEIREYVEAGVKHFALGVQPSDKIVESLELYAKEVIPRI